MFTKATKQQARARIALVGVTGSGKTWTSLLWARALAGPRGRVALIDSENATASKYAGDFSFDTSILDSFSPRSYIDQIKEAEDAGYDVLIIDSLSHAWCGKDGVLAMVDAITARSQSSNSFASWRHVTPEHNELVEALVRCKCDLIVTMRSKTEYVVEDDGRGKKVPRKVGLAPVQRDGLEYEFDVVGEMDNEHRLVITKSRCSKLDGVVILKPDAKPADVLRMWLSDGAAPASAEQIAEIRRLLPLTDLADLADKWIDTCTLRAGVQRLEDLAGETAAKCIAFLMTKVLPAGAGAPTPPLSPPPAPSGSPLPAMNITPAATSPQSATVNLPAVNLDDWEAARAVIIEAAMRMGKRKEEIELAIERRLSLFNRKDRGGSTSVQWRHQLHEAVLSGAINYHTGEITREATRAA